MTMINRVAEAIWKSRLLVQPREPWNPQPGHLSVTEKFCLEAACSIVEAMREPASPVEDAIAEMDRAFGLGVAEAHQMLRTNSGANRIYNYALRALMDRPMLAEKP